MTVGRRRALLALLPDLAMVGGAGMTLVGTYLLLGLAVALIVAGLALAFLGWKAGR